MTSQTTNIEALERWRETLVRPNTAPAMLATSKSTNSILPGITFQQIHQFHNLEKNYQRDTPHAAPKNASKSAQVFDLLGHRQRHFPDVAYVQCCCGYDWCRARVSRKIASRYRRSCEALQMAFETKKALDGTYWERKWFVDSIKSLRRKCDDAKEKRDTRTRQMEEAQNQVSVLVSSFVS